MANARITNQPVISGAGKTPTPPAGGDKPSIFNGIDEESGTIILESTDNPALQAYRQTSNPEKLEKLGYKIIEVLGQGSQGTVYKASDAKTGAMVAIKVLNVDVEMNPNTPRRFLKTARMAAGLDHPNVARILGYGQDGDMLYAIMEFVHGYSLNDLIENQGRLQEAAAVDIMIETLHAMDHLWSHGIAHRDIKPHNILITFDGHVKLVDLGLAKQFVWGKDGNAQQSTAITQANMRVGTPAFMSPEQVRGEQEVDVRSDIYSLGISLFKVLTGKIPFKGKAIEVMSAHLLYPLPPLRNFVPEISPMTERVIMKMSAKAPEARYQSPKELLREFHALSARLAKTGSYQPARKDSAEQAKGPNQPAISSLPSAPKSAPAARETSHGSLGTDESLSKVLPFLKEFEPEAVGAQVAEADDAPELAEAIQGSAKSEGSVSCGPGEESISRVLGLLKEYEGGNESKSPDSSPTVKKTPDDICRFLEVPTVINPRKPDAEGSDIAVKGDGAHVFPVRDSDSISKVMTERSGPFSSPMVLVTDGRDKVGIILNDGDELTFGRSADFSHVVLEDPQVSISHCKVMRSGNNVVVQDCNSRNGTSVDGRKLEAGEVGWMTTELKIGKTSFRLITEA
ncbi:MAG TPA: FHA domain-containing serine/threonine-protein kinase [Candidatus Brocadiia bacterium]|nr:FHA domain-containing serine/threonine-protein kinase [Candidatus Brocadiia bacterium]